jgi:UDP-2,3-diacylglucosamine pyrophosphatase LpxH
MIFIGDVHNQLIKFKEFIISQQIKNTVLIQVGDFGVGFRGTGNYDELNALLEKMRLMLYVCRGNHDNPACFQPELFDSWSRIKFVPDYTLLTLEKKKVLFIGGSISVDRKVLTEGDNWWPEERVNYNIDKIRELGKGVDIVVSHTAPQQFSPQTVGEMVYNYVEEDPNLLTDLRFERYYMQQMCDELVLLNKDRAKRMLWFYGHFHHSALGMYKSFNTRLLGKHEWYEIRK